ncbi:Hypothetical protein HVR_LOCUS298 [uncultured virus]|nr:Hypothetical protein HVR_LOCUS298 [uncultured virus]
MAQVTTFPCEYLVVNSGYTSRLLEDERRRNLSDFCARRGVIPLYIYDNIWGNGQINPITVRDGAIVRGVPTPPDVYTQYEAIQNRLLTNNLEVSGIIVFRVGNFQNATKVFTGIDGLDYCNMYGINDIKFLQNDGRIDLAYVSIEAESG